MKAELYEQAINSFRNGIPLLSKDNFRSYIIKNNLSVYSVGWMRDFFVSSRGDKNIVEFYEYIEAFLSTLTEPVSPEWDNWRMRLPKFYINFDKKYIDIQIGTGNTKN